MNVNTTVAGENYVGGFFGELIYGSIYSGSLRAEGDVTVKTTSSSGSSIGGLIGAIRLDDSVGDCYLYVRSQDGEAAADVNVTGHANVGGIVGSIEIGNSSDFTLYSYSYTTGVVAPNGDGSNAIGGVVGQVHYASGASTGSVNFNHCYNRVSVAGGGSSIDNCGGIAGRIVSVETEVAYSCNVASIGTTGTSKGGLIGYITNSDSDHSLHILECYNSGSIYSDSDNRGGLIGAIDGYLLLEHCFNYGDNNNNGSSKNSNVGGFIGYINSVKHNSGKATMQYGYNISDTGWGSVGGEDQHDGELVIHNIYYCTETCPNGDMSNDRESHGYTKSAMLSLTDSSLPDHWTFPSGVNAMPYLSVIGYYEEYPTLD